MRFSIKAFLLGLTVIGAGASISSANAAEQFDLLSAPFGSGSYSLGGAFEQVINQNNLNLSVSHSESPGFVFNIKRLDTDADARENTIIGSGRGVSDAAIKGEPPFEQKRLKVLGLANYLIGSQWLATLDPSIKTVQDLKGKTVGLGRRPQINWTVQPEALLRTGADLGDDVDIEYLGVKQATSALLDGQVDAAVIGAYLNPITEKVQPAPATQEFLASGRNVHFIEFGHDAVQKLIESGMPLIPITLPAGSVSGQDDPLQTFGDTIGWYASKDFPEDAAYTTTKLIINHVDTFSKAHALGKLMSKESLSYGWDEDEIHPGALRAYKEAGLLK